MSHVIPTVCRAGVSRYRRSMPQREVATVRPRCAALIYWHASAFGASREMIYSQKMPQPCAPTSVEARSPALAIDDDAKISVDAVLADGRAPRKLRGLPTPAGQPRCGLTRLMAAHYYIMLPRGARYRTSAPLRRHFLRSFASIAQRKPRDVLRRQMRRPRHGESLKHSHSIILRLACRGCEYQFESRDSDA